MDTLSYSSLVKQITTMKKEAMDANINAIRATTLEEKEVYENHCSMLRETADSLQAKIDALDNKSPV